MSGLVLNPNASSAAITAAEKAVVGLLTALAAHHVAGSDLLLSTVNKAIDMSAEYKDYYDQLVLILQALRPFFEVARQWLVEGYEHLVALFDWAKETWNTMFGDKPC